MSKNKTDRVPYLGCIPYLLAETARLSELAGRNFYKDCVKSVGMLELDEFIIICHIMANPKLSQSDLSKLTYKGKAHVGKILNEMEEKGYIKRILATNNNIMVKHTEITEKGKNLYEISDERFSRLDSTMFEIFTKEEIEEFTRLLTKLQVSILQNNKIKF